MDYSTLGLPVHHQLWELTQTHVHWVSDAIQPSPLLSSPSHPFFNLSHHQSLFQWVSASASVLSMNIQDWFPLFIYFFHLISFRMDWLDLLAVQGTLKSLQHHSSKASILWRSAFFMVQLSHPYILLEKPQLWLDGPLLDLCLKLSNSSKIGICTGSHHQLQPLIIFLYHSSVPDHSINSWLDF